MNNPRLWLRKQKLRYHRYKISLTLGGTLVLAFALALLLLGGFFFDSISAVRKNKEDLFDHNLRDAVSRLDTDERTALQNNLPSLIASDRELHPVILPRQYYSPPQYSPTASPKRPPRNCFVTLANAKTSTPSDDKLCTYFAENQNFGAFLFVVGEFADEAAAPLRYGDRSFSADHLELSVVAKGGHAKWKIAPQSIPGLGKSKYLTTAFRMTDSGTVELDRRVEGWATFLSGSEGRSRWTFYLRVDFREFMDKTIETDEKRWPPQTDQVQFSLARVDWQAKKPNPPITYAEKGRVELSVSKLVRPLVKNHARVKVFRNGNLQPKASYSPEDSDSGNEHFPIYLSGLDINVRQDPIVRRATFADTDVFLEVSHPGVVIEKRVWLLLLGAFTLVIVTATSCYYAYRRLLRPIFIWTSHSRQISIQGEQAFTLPFSERSDEVGTLAKSFNVLLSESYRRVEREQAENNYRAEVLSLREQNFQVIGHEIRSPLQALSVLIGSEHDGRRYVDRILKALPSLERVHTIEDSITNREAHLRAIDIVAFVEEIVENAPIIGIEYFDFYSELSAAICKVDPEAFEDVLENLIRNANRHRSPETPIIIKIGKDAEKAILSIANYGELIPEENLARIFDYGFSTTEGEPGRIAGIGLSISRHNILKMRGLLTVENIGTDQVRFTIALPLVAT
ncbi:HAMP domain-containing histidine kinase [Massilia sp. MB5]|uniref:sensor histidine kinase n=1 Tax=Massilia sp. MB5 TaxID=2919578 RepID=UPI001F0EDD32|nr:HAMP domain-containing sensor histidine kinase [Massilia sp. MB5]UMR31392.1 HAMP domain-containing histidine kinase [Massilia sp. MB5]